jgi:putative SOS response-associated peptidase YedK
LNAPFCSTSIQIIIERSFTIEIAYLLDLFASGTRDWQESYAILTTAANIDAAPFHDRQKAVRRDQRMT